MKPKNYEVLMDIYMGVLNAPAIQFTTEDFGMCQITFSLLEDRITPYNLSNCIVRMVINGQQQDCTISDANNGKAEIVLLQSMFTEVGHVFAELQIYDATNQTMRLTTPTFKYTVRKSLMDDNTVQADANYSILQQMILNVSNADKVSSEALKIANNAKAICDDLVPKANTASQNAQEALDRAESVVTQEELAQKVTLDGNDTKFDFIKNKVVQDGLVFAELGKVDTPVDVVKKNISVCMILNLSTSESSYVNHGLFPTANFFTYKNKIKLKFKKPDQTYSDGEYSINFTEGMHKLELRIVDNTIQAFVDGIALNSPQPIYPLSSSEKIATCYISGNPMTKSKSIGVFINENKILAPQEIAHNLSALNNSPSIKELSTTDSTGKTSILKLASDTDHVEDRAGRTQEQINRTFYKRMCKEMPSQNGEPITVKNGEEGYVLSAEIKGNTQLFKRVKGSQDEWIVIPNDEGRDTVAFEYKLDSTQAIISNNGEKYPIYATEEDKANKKVISLGGVGDVQDTLEILEDGSVVLTDIFDRVTLDGSEDEKWSLQGANRIICPINGLFGGEINTTNCICDTINSSSWNTLTSKDNQNLIATINDHVGIGTGFASTEQELRQKLQANPIAIIFKKKIPTTTHIPKELIPAILTHKTNILEVGGAVKPSSFKVTVPVDRIAEIEARLQALESTTVDVVLNK
ncbi:BppU family phage baseplate upper protein [Zhenhengia sp.]|uniref:BppU family phage baseplate upper protein n=1 Tax=Zhenhengia sp. TaxID=2944208 RepID=UPI003078DFCF